MGRRQKRDVGGRGVQVGRRWRAERRQSAEETRTPFFEKTRTVACNDQDACACVLQHCRALEQKQLSWVVLGPRECRQILIMPEGIIHYTFTFTYFITLYINKLNYVIICYRHVIYGALVHVYM